MPSSYQHSLVQANMLAGKIHSDRGRVEVQLRQNLLQQRACWTSKNLLVCAGTDPHPHHMHFRSLSFPTSLFL